MPAPGAEERLEAASAWLRARHGAQAGPIRGVLSPYRICPLGAHSDHQHGPVLGTAVDACTALAFLPSRDSTLRLSSAGHPGRLEMDLSKAEDGAADAPWMRYARGAAAVLRELLPERAVGLHARVEGTLPGVGLASSASVVAAYLLAIAHVNGVLLSEAELVAFARRVENEHVGVACGILDPASIVGSRRGHLLAIDTAASRWEPVALGGEVPGARFLVACTGISRRLLATGFNQRVEECREAARRLGRAAGRREVELLGDLPDEVFDAHMDALTGPLFRRARHFRTERARVGRGLDRWRRGDLAGFGALMNASCESSINDYETGSPELCRLQEILLATPGVLGARFSGGGFGGCSVALVEDAAAEEAARRVQRTFDEVFPHLLGKSRTFLVESDDGARMV